VVDGVVYLIFSDGVGGLLSLMSEKAVMGR